jgi:hypothetical protein
VTDEDQQRTFGKIAKALAAFQAEVPTVPKNKTANAGSYSYAYADLADIAQAAYPILSKYQLAFTSWPNERVLHGMLVHESGEHFDGSLEITGRTMQEIGSSITYGRRYLFGCLTGIVTDADDDGAAASVKPKARKSAPAPAGDLRTDAQSKKLAIELKEAGLTERERAHQYVVRVIGRPIESTKELTEAEASQVIEELVAAKKKAADPVTGEVAAANVDPWAQR